MRKRTALSRGTALSVTTDVCLLLSGAQMDSRLKMDPYRALAVMKANSIEQQKSREGHSLLLCAC